MKFSVLLKKKATWLLVVAVVGAGYYWYRAKAATPNAAQYVLGTVQKETLTVSVNGTGQVSNLNQIDVKPEVSGKVLKVFVTEGQTVAPGTALVQLDATDAYKTLRDAQLNLESAQLAYQKLAQPSDALSVTQAENSLADAIQNKQTVQNDLEKSYADGFTDIDNAFLDLPGIMSGLRDVLLGNTYATTQWNMDYYVNSAASYSEEIKNYRDEAYKNFLSARSAYDQNFSDYKNTSRGADKAAVEALLKETYNTTQSISAAVKSANNLIQFYEDLLVARNFKPAVTADTQLSSLNTYTGKINGHSTTLLAVVNSIQNNKVALVSAAGTITEKTQSLEKLKAGADTFDLKSQQLTLRQRQASVADAYTALGKYTIRAPIGGQVASIAVKPGNDGSSGSAVATIIAPQQVAAITLNEVDVSKIKAGDKATLSFDAVEDLTMTGKVAIIDSIGTVSQGVVTYNVKIIFDTQDSRIKTGMSVSAAIITDVHPDVLTVPVSAVKTANGSSYVQMFDTNLTPAAGATGVTSPTPPRQQPVEVGLSNDTSTEITSGLKEGDKIVTRTITATTASTQSAPSLFGAAGGRTGGVNAGAAVRATTGR